jgi:Domain of unknown function (DUF4760)
MSFWDEAARYAPIATGTAACVALGVAIISVHVQRNIARKRAAIDFFLKTEMDDKMLAAYAESREGFKLLREGAPIDSFIRTDHYPLVRKYLNIHELMAAGIDNGVLDEKTCFSFWGDQLIQDCDSARSLIDRIRQIPGHGTAHTYHSVRVLVRKWRGAVQRDRRALFDHVILPPA